MYTTLAMSKLFLAFLLATNGVTAHAFAIRGQGHLRNATEQSHTPFKLSPHAFPTSRRPHQLPKAAFVTRLSNATVEAEPTTTTMSAAASSTTTSTFMTEDAIYTQTALPSPTAATTLSSVACGPTSTFILQAISPDVNVSAQYIYSPCFESGDTFSLTKSLSTATRLTLDSLHGLVTSNRSTPLYATSAIDGSYGPMFMDSMDDLDTGNLHQKLVFTLDANDMLVVGDGRPGLMQVQKTAVAIGYATLMVHTELRDGYAGLQARAICID